MTIIFDKEYFEKTKIVKQQLIFEKNKGLTENRMHICFNIDESFFRPAGVAITSILEKNPKTDFSFHFFTDAVDVKDITALQKTAEKYCCNIYVYIMDMVPFAAFHIKHDRFTRVSYFRLYMAKILKQQTRYFLYLDADVMCTGDINVFRRIDLQGHVMAVVSDFADAVKSRSAYLKLKNGMYFNSGVLWIDTELWEQQEITERCFLWQGIDPNRFTCHDQDVLNLTLDGNVKFLCREFNFLGRLDRTAPNNCIIYHFFGREKPWERVLTKYDRLWRRYCEISAWDTISGKFPPKSPKYYHDYKEIGGYTRRNGNIIQALQCYFWYVVLKVRGKFL